MLQITSPGRSLMIIKKNEGPRIEHLGTPT